MKPGQNAVPLIGRTPEKPKKICPLSITFTGMAWATAACQEENCQLWTGAMVEGVIEWGCGLVHHA